jgi:hypothetical protein
VPVAGGVAPGINALSVVSGDDALLPVGASDAVVAAMLFSFCTSGADDATTLEVFVELFWFKFAACDCIPSSVCFA